MGFLNTYMVLANIQILHNYFLNQGATPFNDLEDRDKERLLADYDFNDFMEITPSLVTAKYMKNHRFEYRSTKNELFVFGQKSVSDNQTFIPVNEDDELIFLIKIKDGIFDNYTDIEVTNDKIYLFTNEMPEGEIDGLELINLSSDTDYVSGDQHVDISEVDGIYGNLEKMEKRKLFGIVRLKLITTDTTKSLLTADDHEMKDDHPKFKIHFNNRNTLWKFNYSRKGIQLTTINEKPLAKNGFVEIDSESDFDPVPDDEDLIFPNPKPENLLIEESNYYSEIFIQ